MDKRMQVKSRKYKKDRIEKGFCDSDLFEMRAWLTEILPSMIEGIFDNSGWGYDDSPHFRLDEDRLLRFRDSVRLLEASNDEKNIENVCDLLCEVWPDLWY